MPVLDDTRRGHVTQVRPVWPLHQSPAAQAALCFRPPLPQPDMVRRPVIHPKEKENRTRNSHVSMARHGKAGERAGARDTGERVVYAR
eukprot:2491011-Rhodomonas_salina.1